jgi:hypothetical protein
MPEFDSREFCFGEVYHGRCHLAGPIVAGKSSGNPFGRSLSDRRDPAVRLLLASLDVLQRKHGTVMARCARSPSAVRVLPGCRPSAARVLPGCCPGAVRGRRERGRSGFNGCTRAGSAARESACLEGDSPSERRRPRPRAARHATASRSGSRSGQATLARVLASRCGTSEAERMESGWCAVGGYALWAQMAGWIPVALGGRCAVEVVDAAMR